MEKRRTKIERFPTSRCNLLRGCESMFKIGKFVSIILLAMGLVFLLAHWETSNAQKKTSGSKLRCSIAQDPIALDPAHLESSYDRNIVAQIFQGLVTFDVTTQPPFPIIPVLAKSYEVSKDAKMITFKLHEGVNFHHGYGELTSEDVVFSLKRHSDPKIASLAKNDLVDVERIEALNKYTVRIYLKNAAAFTLLGNLAWHNLGFILSKEAVMKLGDKIETMPIGTGPYYFDRWAPGEKVVLKKFDKYWRTPAKIDEIEFWIIPEEMVSLGALEKGDLDIAKISQMGSYRRAETIKGIYIAGFDKGSTENYILYLNHKKKPMDNLKVRRALAHALNMKSIASRIGPILAYFPSPIPSALFAATDEFWFYEYNIDKARQLLAEAGYPKGFELQMIYKKGKLYEQIALEVKNCWRDIVDVKLELIEEGVFTNRLRKFDHHVALWAMGRVVPSLYAECYGTGNPRNNSNYLNPEVDKIIDKSRTATTEQDARKYYREFQRLVTEDVANIWPAEMINITAINNKVKGLGFLVGTVLLERSYIE